MREQPYAAMSSCSGGTRWPGGQSPERMSSEISARIRRCKVVASPMRSGAATGAWKFEPRGWAAHAVSLALRLVMSIQNITRILGCAGVAMGRGLTRRVRWRRGRQLRPQRMPNPESLLTDVLLTPGDTPLCAWRDVYRGAAVRLPASAAGPVAESEIGRAHV